MRKRAIGVRKPGVVFGPLWPEHIVLGRVAQTGFTRKLRNTEISGRKLCKSPRIGLSNFGPRDSFWPTTTQSEVVMLADALELILLNIKVAENPRPFLPGRPKPAAADVPRSNMTEDFGQRRKQLAPRSKSPNPAGARILNPKAHTVGNAEFNDLDTKGRHQAALLDFFPHAGPQIREASGEFSVADRRGNIGAKAGASRPRNGAKDTAFLNEGKDLRLDARVKQILSFLNFIGQDPGAALTKQGLSPSFATAEKADSTRP
ncbi:unnamed protein product [Polarella glacialis]|uniref:Uncharacterized protein n=1 Tax=Polarella glacialis TaxID=89957 RepID=A0A813IH88_POLGL|nr:unnamed protein product [Polarella glacialis]